MPGIVNLDGPTAGERIFSMALQAVGARNSMEQVELQRGQLELERDSLELRRQIQEQNKMLLARELELRDRSENRLDRQQNFSERVYGDQAPMRAEALYGQSLDNQIKVDALVDDMMLDPYKDEMARLGVQKAIDEAAYAAQRSKEATELHSQIYEQNKRALDIRNPDTPLFKNTVKQLYDMFRADPNTLGMSNEQVQARAMAAVMNGVAPGVAPEMDRLAEAQRVNVVQARQNFESVTSGLLTAWDNGQVDPDQISKDHPDVYRMTQDVLDQLGEKDAGFRLKASLWRSKYRPPQPMAKLRFGEAVASNALAEGDRSTAGLFARVTPGAPSESETLFGQVNPQRESYLKWVKKQATTQPALNTDSSSIQQGRRTYGGQ